MRTYLFDLDDTLVMTIGHASNVIYPLVAERLDVPIPKAQTVRDTWGQRLDTVLPALFSGLPISTILPILREIHRSSPPPPFPGIVRRLANLRQAGCVVRIFSSGDPEIVRNTVEKSLGFNPDEPGLIYSLTKGRRLRTIDVDIMLEGVSISDSPSSILIFSDNPKDRAPAIDDPNVLFYGVISGIDERAAHERAGIPSTMVFSTLTEALDAIEERRPWASEIETPERLGQLQKGIIDRTVVIFIGAGVSVDSGLPTAAKLAQHFGQKEDSLQRIMTTLSSDPATYGELYRLIGDPSRGQNQIHRALVMLDAPYYVGTNWDHLLERAFIELYGDSCGDNVGVAYVDAHLPGLTGKRNAYIKLHGDIDRKETLVADVRSYASRISHPRLLDKLVEVLLNSSQILFVGYSLSDINVMTQLLEHGSWEGSAPPLRYAILSNVSETDYKFLRSSGIHVIDVEATSSDIGRRTFEVLARLYDAKENFAADAQLMSGHSETEPIELYYRALTHYQESQFTKAIDALNQVQEKVLDWRQNLPLLARYSYLTVKLYDKLEQWDKLSNIDELYLREQFRRVEQVMPGSMFAWMKGHYQSALALAALRAGRPQEALSSIEMSIDAARGQPQAERMLLADRRTVRAIVLQYLSMAGESIDESLIDDLYFARLTYERFGGLGSDHEIHFCGRYYGATVFAALTLNIDEPDLRKILGTVSLVEAARRSHLSKQRVPYGIVAGRYCEAFLRYEMLRSGDRSAADISTLRLVLDEYIESELGPVARFKRKALAQQIRALLDSGEDEPRLAEMPDNEQTTRNPYILRHIENLTLAGWLATPLN